MTLALPFDPILLLAVIGLCAASLVTISGATSDDIAGDPHYYVNRQAVYFVVGAVLAVVLARIDYSRLRGAKYVVYGLLIASILAVSALGSVARGSRRAIDVGFFSFQASELGKVLLVVALAAFVVDRPRALHNRDTTRPGHAPHADPGRRWSSCSPTSAPAWSTSSSASPCSSWPAPAGATSPRSSRSSRWPSPSPSWSRRRPA